MSDFAWVDRRIHIRKTDIKIPLDRHLVAEVVQWLLYFAVLGVAAGAARLTRRRPLAIWFTPDRPPPWYLIRGAALWAGIGAARTEAEADAAFYFEDATSGSPPQPTHAASHNFACSNVSKSHVAAVFEEVFGYPLTVDPLAVTGPIVEKSEKNGVHDGRIVEAPAPARQGYAYQRLVDTADEAGVCRDFRTPCVGGSPVVVWIKHKPGGGRFAIHNRRVTLREPSEVFSQAELAQIRRFTARMGLDWGGLDILRDRHDGRIYIVDVNKTDLGPVIALSWFDKIRSMRRLGDALERLIAQPQGVADRPSAVQEQASHAG